MHTHRLVKVILEETHTHRLTMEISSHCVAQPRVNPSRFPCVSSPQKNVMAAWMATLEHKRISVPKTHWSEIAYEANLREHWHKWNFLKQWLLCQ